jgi:YesN/AraC family two-component response regulator
MTDRSETIILVDDEPFVRVVVVEALVEDGGFIVIEAENADQALTVLENQPIDIVITDVTMPGNVDGITLANIVTERWPDTAVIVISGWRDSRTGEVPKTAAFLAKPFRPSELLRLVDDVIASKQEPRELGGAPFIPAGLKTSQLHTGIGAAAGLAQPLQEPDE